MRRSTATWFAILVIGGIGVANADSWLPPRTERYLSADGRWQLTVEPRGISSPAAYFGDQLDNKPAPGGRPGDQQRSAVGTMMHRVGGDWQQVWRQPLRNDVAPVEAVVLPGGAVLTLDNWHSTGYGPDAVVLYDGRGRQTGHYALIDFLPRDYVRALPRSVSSLQWRGKANARPDGKSVEVPVVVRSPDHGQQDRAQVQHIPVVFEPDLGTVRLPSGPGWKNATASAQRTLEAQLQAQAAWRAGFIGPLRGPPTNNEAGWHHYLEEAFFRLDPDWHDFYPAKTVLRTPGAVDYAASEKWLHEALWEDAPNGPLMLAGLAPDALVSRLEVESRNLKPGALANVRIYLALDGEHFALAKAALSPTGASVIQLDPTIGIPQRPERLATFLKNEKAAAAEEAADAAFR